MEVIIRPSEINGTIQGPASKSSMQRACAAALLARGETIIRNAGHSNDDQAALSVIRGLGAGVEWLEDGSLRITSHGIDPLNGQLDCGESGLGIRMFTPIIAISNKHLTITGRGSLSTRPMDFFDDMLPKLGVRVSSNKGRLPIEIQGPMKPGNIEIDGSLSSQFLTGLLMAYGANDARDVKISVVNLKSKPYIDLTLRVMKIFGLKVPENRDYLEFYFDALPNANGNSSRAYDVEADWSGGAFLLVAGAVAGSVKVNGLDPDSVQADKAILNALSDAGAILEIHQGQMSVSSPRSDGRKLKPFQFDATDCPDLFPPLVALASYCEGRTMIKGVERLTHKESNRGLTLQEEFGKMGVTIELKDDLMIIHGKGEVKGAHVHSRHDHRIAMACAVAAVGAVGNTWIEEAQAIEKSYPGFFEDLQKLGGSIEGQNQQIAFNKQA